MVLIVSPPLGQRKESVKSILVLHSARNKHPLYFSGLVLRPLLLGSTQEATVWQTCVKSKCTYVSNNMKKERKENPITDCNWWLNSAVCVYNRDQGERVKLVSVSSSAVVFKKLCCSLPAVLIQISRLKSLISLNNALSEISFPLIPMKFIRQALDFSGALIKIS